MALLENDLKSATRRAEALLAERRKIQDALSAAETAFAAAQREHSDAAAALAEAEANSVLMDQPPDSKAARKRCSAAREALESFQARVTGLHNKLSANEALLGEARNALRQARAHASEVTLAQLRGVVLQRAAELKASMQELLSAESGLSGRDNSASIWFRTAFLADPSNFAANLLMAESISRTAWEGNQHLASLALPEHRLMLERLDRELDESVRAVAA